MGITMMTPKGQFLGFTLHSRSTSALPPGDRFRREAHGHDVGFGLKLRRLDAVLQPSDEVQIALLSTLLGCRERQDAVRQPQRKPDFRAAANLHPPRTPGPAPIDARKMRGRHADDVNELIGDAYRPSNR